MPGRLPLLRRAGWPTSAGPTARWSSRKLEPMPDVPGEEAAELLDQAEDIVNAVGPEVLAEVRRGGRAGGSPANAAGGAAGAELRPVRDAAPPTTGR